MAKSLGPYTPKEGWEKRWLVQAFELAVRSPMILLVHIAFIFLIAGLKQVTEEQGLLAFLAIPLMIAVATFAHGLSTWIIAGSDGRTDADVATLVKRVAPIAKIVLLVAIAVTSVVMMLSAAGPEPVAVDAAAAAVKTSQSHAITMLYGAIATEQLSYVVVSAFAVLWIPSIASLEMDFRQARHVHRFVLDLGLKFWLPMIVSVLVLTDVFISIHPIVGVLFICLRDAWFYVAAREIVVGIDENGHPATQTSLQTS